MGYGGLPYGGGLYGAGLAAPAAGGPGPHLSASTPDMSAIGPDDDLVFRIEPNPDTLSPIAISLGYIKLRGVHDTVLFWNGTDVLPPFATDSSVVDEGGGSTLITLNRDGGWALAVEELTWLIRDEDILPPTVVTFV